LRTPSATGKDCGLGKFPSHDFAVNSAWLAASLTAATLLAWLKLLALDGDLAPRGTQDPPLPGPAHRRPADPQQPTLSAENPRDLALGRCPRHRLDQDRCPAAETDPDRASITYHLREPLTVSVLLFPARFPGSPPEQARLALAAVAEAATRPHRNVVVALLGDVARQQLAQRLRPDGRLAEGHERIVWASDLAASRVTVEAGPDPRIHVHAVCDMPNQSNALVVAGIQVAQSRLYLPVDGAVGVEPAQVRDYLVGCSGHGLFTCLVAADRLRHRQGIGLRSLFAAPGLWFGLRWFGVCLPVCEPAEGRGMGAG
jgi:hypothetical protein